MVEAGFTLSLIQPKESLCRNANLHDCSLFSGNVESLAIDNTGLFALPRMLPPVLWRILTADFVYIFYPGTLPRIVALMCMAIHKPYGLYLRGEQFSTAGSGGEIFRSAKFITTVSSFLGKTIGHLNSRIIPIRPMFDITEKDSMRRDFRSRSNEPLRILFVGRLEEAKGIPELIEAAHILQARGFIFSLSLVGGGPLHAELSSRYGNDPADPIRVHGPIQDKSVLMSEYESADFFVLPTHHEGFPRVLYEAMIKSMVIFTTFVGGIPGLMTDGVNCVEIPVKSPDAIADSIEKTSQDKALMMRLSENGFETIMTVLNTYPTHLETVRGQLNV
jgi:glycosyltransferase involved in cell wall biosynthesis